MPDLTPIHPPRRSFMSARTSARVHGLRSPRVATARRRLVWLAASLPGGKKAQAGELNRVSPTKSVSRLSRELPDGSKLFCFGEESSSSSGSSSSSSSIESTALDTMEEGYYRPTSIESLLTANTPLIPFVPHNIPPQKAEAHARRIVIAPGFGNAPEDYDAMADALDFRGYDVRCVDLKRGDWLEVFKRGLVNPDFWAATATTSPHYSWYLEKLKQAVDDAGGEDVVIVAHSAGGWLARAFLHDPAPGMEEPPRRRRANLFEGALPLSERRDAHARRRQNGHQSHGVSAIVTLGSPQRPPPRPSRDFTGGALTWVNRWTAPLVGEQVPFICVGGRAVVGIPAQTSGGQEFLKQAVGARGYAADDPYAQMLEVAEPTTEEELYWTRRAANGYSEVSGNGFTLGDGVVPLGSSLLRGARNLVIDGVFHAPDRASPRWYGSEDVLDSWLRELKAETK